MTPKRLLLFSRDPGGANTIIPLVQPLEQKGYSVSLYGKDISLRKYQDHGLLGKNICETLERIEPVEVTSFLKSLNVDLVLTGTSSDDFTEKYLWQSAQQLGIPSAAIIDQWMSYGMRFSRYGLSEYRQYAQKPSIDFLPSRIFIMDKLAKNEAIAEGLPPDKLVVTGQPYFETLMKKASTIHPTGEIKSRHLIDPDTALIVFASEPIMETYHDQEQSTCARGYDQYSIFSALLDGLEEVHANSLHKFVLLIRLHPKEKKDSINRILEERAMPFRVIVGDESEPFCLMKESDLIVGMSSMFLIEAALLGRPILSVQIGLNQKDPFVLSRMGLTKTVLDKQSLGDQIKEALTKTNTIAYNLEVVRSPVQNVIAEVEKLLWGS
ncbi:MAG: CDP-glycerol glycerophosphotransferase family protein [Candidatus Margulisiibacteriota bacterium]